MYTVEAYLGGVTTGFTVNNRTTLTTLKSSSDESTNQLNEFKTKVGGTPNYVTLTFDVNLTNPLMMDITTPTFEVRDTNDTVIGPFDSESTYQSLVNLGYDGLVINKKYDGDVDGFMIVILDSTKVTLKP